MIQITFIRNTQRRTHLAEGGGWANGLGKKREVGEGVGTKQDGFGEEAASASVDDATYYISSRQNPQV